MAGTKRIQDHIDVINGAVAPDDLFADFSKIMNGYGYDKVAFGCATDCPSLGLKKRHGHVSSFAADFLKHYAENDLSVIDPVHIHLVEKRTPTFWSDCAKDATGAARQLMMDAADVGMSSGIVIPLADLSGELSMVSVARDEPIKKEDFRTLADVNLLSMYFFQTYKTFIKAPPPVMLAPREYEILNWAAEGKTDVEISTITMISTATVRYHWKNIFRKFNVYSRVSAVSAAIQARVITPRNIMK